MVLDDARLANQHLRLPKSRKQYPWSAAEKSGAYLLEQALSSPELLQITQESIPSLKNTSNAEWWNSSASGGRCGTMSLLCTTLNRVSTRVPRNCAIAALPTRGHPKLCTSTRLLNLALSRNPAISERAPPRLWPVVRMVAVGWAAMRAATFSLIFCSMSLQSSRKPACISHPLQSQATFSKVKSSIQFWMLADPLKTATIQFLAPQQPTKAEARVTRLLMQVTSLKVVKLLPDWQFQFSRHLWGQQASPDRMAYSLDTAGSQALSSVRDRQLAPTRHSNTKQLGLIIAIITNHLSANHHLLVHLASQSILPVSLSSSIC